MFAVIDLGSNSFHLLIAEFSGDRFNVVTRCSQKIQLAENLYDNGELTATAIQRGIRCLREFKQTLAHYPISQLNVVATQALRKATNARTFIEQAHQVGFDIEIISGDREAELIYRGISDPLPDSPHNRLVIDIGGASTEVAIGCNQQVLFAQSVEMGCVSWRDRYFHDGIDYAENGYRAKQAVKTQFQESVPPMQTTGWEFVYASSGSAKMLARIARANGWSDGAITAEGISAIEDHLTSVHHIDEINLPGLSPERQDLLAPGVAILAGITEALGIQKIHYSHTALREGLLSEISNRRIDYQLHA